MEKIVSVSTTNFVVPFEDNKDGGERILFISVSMKKMHGTRHGKTGFLFRASIYIDLFLAWPERIFLSDVVSCLRADIFIPLMRLPRLDAITRDESKFIGLEDRFLFNGRIVLKERGTKGGKDMKERRRILD